MPNHIHIIWQQLKKNGKETVQGSFLKYAAHELLKKLKATGESVQYEVNAANKKHEIWQRDSLSIETYSRRVAKEKLDYIHFNPVSGVWKLSKDDLDYYYSSAGFYETGVDDFGFLNDCIANLMGTDMNCFVCHEPRRSGVLMIGLRIKPKKIFLSGKPFPFLFVS